MSAAAASSCGVTHHVCSHARALRRRSLATQSSPELQKLFGEDPDANDSLTQFTAPPVKPPSRGMPGSGLGALARPTLGAKAGGQMDTPRGFEEELTEDELLRRELEKVKRERDVLMNSILAAREQAGAWALRGCAALRLPWSHAQHVAEAC